MKYRVLILVALAFISCSRKESYVIHPAETGPLGDSAMIASAHPLATNVGVRILKNGGNAFDAAVAVHFTLAVVYPQAGNLGGGGFAVIRLSNGTTNTLDFRETAPLAAYRDLYLDSTGQVIKGRSTLGHLAVGVPGSVAGIWTLHQKYGSKPWSELLEPAIEIAAEGHELTHRTAAVLNKYQQAFRKANHYSPWIIQKEPWQAGDLIRQSELSGTLTIIQKNGRDGFYKGIVADSLIAEMEKGNGLITYKDLDQYQPKWRPPLISYYKDYRIIGMPPPSSGGIAVAQLLYGAEKLKLSDYRHNSTTYIHLIAELEKRVFADRTKHLGDSDFYPVPIDSLISPSYLDRRFKDISVGKLTNSRSIHSGKIGKGESTETTHYSIVDQNGHAVSITTTLNGSMGSKVMVKGAGFFLNNEMDDFSAKPGEPNMFGLMGSEANAIAPGKRMLSSMTPTIVDKNNQLQLVAGTPGGATIISSVFQVILNTLDHDMGMQNGVNATKVHHQWYPDSLQLERHRIPPKVINELEEMGYKIKYRKTMGRMDCILVRQDGQLEGGSDYLRGDNYSEGF